MYKKIYIIGTGRSGKSFLANKLSQKTDIKHYDLDDVVFVEIGKKIRDIEERNKELAKILESQSWIIEGAYTEEWIMPALEEADAIVWVNTSRTIKLLRFFRKIISEEKEMIKTFYGREKLVAGFKYKQYDRSMSAYQKRLEPFKDKVIILKSKKEIDNFLSSF
ncbi:MAG: hypothetical protein AB1643_03035 [Patescibacteria group bacterium]